VVLQIQFTHFTALSENRFLEYEATYPTTERKSVKHRSRLAELDIRYAMETDDGAVIEIVNYGFRHGPKEVLDAIFNQTIGLSETCKA